jgi:predicted ATP-grasp superfamily ATP-dependent carboligase
MFRMKALITDASGGVALNVTRSLGRNGIEVTAGSCNKHAISFYSKYCTHKFIHSNPQENETQFIKDLIEELRIGNYDVMLPLGGYETNVISIHRGELSRYVRIPLVRHEALEIANDKGKTLNVAMKNGISCPKTLFVKNVDEVERIKRDLTYPVVIKPQQSSGSKGLAYIDSPDNLVSTYKRLSNYYSDFLIQDYIPHGGDTFGLGALFNDKSEPRAVFIHRRIREYPITGGPSTMRISVENPEIIEQGVKLLKALDWYGIAMVEFKVDPRTDRPVLMEINPRFWGSLNLAIMSGVDFPYLLYRMAIEGDIEPIMKYRLNVKGRWLLWGDVNHLLSVLKGHPNTLGFKTPGRVDTFFQFMKFYEKDLYYDIISSEDPKPAIFKILSTIIRQFK